MLAGTSRGPLLLLFVFSVCVLSIFLLFSSSFLEDYTADRAPSRPVEPVPVASVPVAGHPTISSPSSAPHPSPQAHWTPGVNREVIPNLPELRELYSKSDKVVLLVMPKPDSRLAETVHNAIANLPLEWKVQVFHSPETKDYIDGRKTLARYALIGRLIFSPTLDRQMSIVDYSNLLKSAQFWEQVQGEHVLTIQTDSVLCSNSPYSINDFLQYDYIGAPWKAWPHLLAGNGGLSLRRRSKMLETIEKCTLATPKIEDVWFAQCFVELPKQGNFTVQLAPQEVAQHFSVETMYSSNPLGAHKPWLYIGREQLRQLFRFCPELRSVAP